MSKRNEYLEKVKEQLEEWEYDIDRLEARLEDAQADGKVKLDKTINELKAKQKELQLKLRDLEGAAEEAWTDIRDGVELAWDSLKLGFLAAKSEFIEKSSAKKK
jgi:chromosome segregation ATPase